MTDEKASSAYRRTKKHNLLRCLRQIRTRRAGSPPPCEFTSSPHILHFLVRRFDAHTGLKLTTVGLFCFVAFAEFVLDGQGARLRANSARRLTSDTF